MSRTEQERKYREWLISARGVTAEEAAELARQPRPQPFAPPHKPIAERWDNVVGFERPRAVWERIAERI